MDNSKIYIYGKEVVTPYYLNEAVADKATKAYVDESIANIEASDVDLTNYYTKEEINEELQTTILGLPIVDVPTEYSELPQFITENVIAKGLADGWDSFYLKFNGMETPESDYYKGYYKFEELYDINEEHEFKTVYFYKISGPEFEPVSRGEAGVTDINSMNPAIALYLNENNELQNYGMVHTTNSEAHGISVLQTDYNYTVPYEPQYDGSPATKKYVDDAIATVAKGDTILVTIKTDSQNSVKTQLQEKVYPLIQSADIPNEKIIINFCKGTLTSSYNVNGLFYVGSVDSNRFKLYAHTKETESEENTDSYCYTALYDVGQVLVCELSGDTITSLKIDQSSSQRGWFLEINPQNYVETKPFLATKTYQPATKAYVDNTIQANMQMVKVDNLPVDKVVQKREGYGTIGMIYVTKLERTLQNTASSVSMKLIDEFATNPDNQELYGKYFMVFGHRSSTAHNRLLGYMTDYPELLQMASSSTMAFWGLYDADKPVYSLTTNADSTEVIVNKITSNVSAAPYTSTWYWNTGSGYQNLYLNANCDIQYYNSSSLSGINLEFDNQTGSNGAGEIQIMPNCPVLFYLDGKLTPPHGESVLGYKEGTYFLANGNFYVSKFDSQTTGSTISYELYIGGDYATKEELYATKEELYATKEELNNAIGNITSFSLMPVDVLPEVDIQTNVIYLVPSENPEETNVRNEYVYVNDAWEMVGTTAIDLSNYYTKEEVNAKVDSDSILTFNYTRETTATSEDLIAFFTTVIERYNATGMIPEVRIIHFSYPRTPFRITGWEVNGDTSFYKYDFNLWAFDMQDNVYTSPEYMYIIGGIKMTEDLSAISYVQFQSIETDAMVRTFTTLDQTNGVRNLVLTTANTATYTPTANYHPSTKKYVDDAITTAVEVLPTKDYVDGKVETAIQGLTGEELDSSLNNGQLNAGDSITCTQDYLGKYEQGNIYLVQEKERGEVSIVQQLQDLGFNVSISSRLLSNDIKYFYIVEYGDEGDMYCAYSKVPLNVSGSKFPSDGWKTFSVRKMNDSDPNFYYAQWDTNKNLSSMTELTSSTNDGKYWASQFSSSVVATYTNDPAAASLYTPYVVDPTELVKYTINITPKTDLSNYILKTEVEANYYSKEEIDAKFAEIMTILPVASQEEVQEILSGEVSE